MASNERDSMNETIEALQALTIKWKQLGRDYIKLSEQMICPHDAKWFRERGLVYSMCRSSLAKILRTMSVVPPSATPRGDQS
jgi:hypothetical protein